MVWWCVGEGGTWAWEREGLGVGMVVGKVEEWRVRWERRGRQCVGGRCDTVGAVPVCATLATVGEMYIVPDPLVLSLLGEENEKN